MNTSRKGGVVERLCRDLLVLKGYKVEMFRLSKGAFDRVATPVPGTGIFAESETGRARCETFHKDWIRFIQVKANAWGMPDAAMQRAWEVRLPEPCTREWWMRTDPSRVKASGKAYGFGAHGCWKARLLVAGHRWIEIPLFPNEWYCPQGDGFGLCPGEGNPEGFTGNSSGTCPTTFEGSEMVLHGHNYLAGYCLEHPPAMGGVGITVRKSGKMKLGGVWDSP